MIVIRTNGYGATLYFNGYEVGPVDLTTVELLAAVVGFEFELEEEE